jgi:hypothetical protein
MCNDLILSFLYFSILFGVNFFLFGLIKTYFTEIYTLSKLKKCLQNNYFEKSYLSYFYFLKKLNEIQKKNYFLFFFRSKKNVEIKDIFLIKKYIYDFKMNRILFEDFINYSKYSSQYYFSLMDFQF